MTVLERCQKCVRVTSQCRPIIIVNLELLCGYEHCMVTIVTDALYNKIQETIGGQYVIMSSGATVDVRCQGDIPRRIVLKEGVHLLHVQTTCMYSTEMWMLKPIKHVRGKASSKVTHMNTKSERA